MFSLIQRHYVLKITDNKLNSMDSVLVDIENVVITIYTKNNMKGLVGGPLLVGGLGPGPPGPPLNPALGPSFSRPAISCLANTSKIGPSFSRPAFSCRAHWSVNFMSCNFSQPLPASRTTA